MRPEGSAEERVTTPGVDELSEDQVEAVTGGTPGWVAPTRPTPGPNT